MLSPGSPELKILLLAVILGAAVIIDVRSHRIPNLLCLCALTAGLVVQFVGAGSDGVVAGVSGLLTGFAVLMPMFLLGGMGAGDVKLMASVGTFLGATDTLVAAAITLVVGGAMAAGIVAWSQFHGWAAARGLPGFEPCAQGDAWTLEFPYAAAIAAGVATALLPVARILTF